MSSLRPEILYINISVSVITLTSSGLARRKRCRAIIRFPWARTKNTASSSGHRRHLTSNVRYLAGGRYFASRIISFSFSFGRKLEHLYNVELSPSLSGSCIQDIHRLRERQCQFQSKWNLLTPFYASLSKQ